MNAETCTCPLTQPTPSMAARGFKPWVVHTDACQRADR